MLKFVELVRSLGLGAMLVSGFIGLIYLHSPDLFERSTNLVSIGVVGALIGAGFQRLFLSVLSPVFRFAGYYFKIIQLWMLQRRGIITKKHKQQLIKDLTQEFFQIH